MYTVTARFQLVASAALVSLALGVAGPLSAQGRVISPCAVPSSSRPVSAPCSAQVVRIATSTLVDVQGRVAHTTVTETFENRGGSLGEADFIYPLPNGAAFEELRLEIDGALVPGELLDARSAKETYERIVRQQRDPALVEWAGLGLLRTRIFPFRGGERRTVVIKHKQLLTRDGDALRVTGKLVGVDDPRDERATGSFRIRWNDESIGTPWSPTHQVNMRAEGASRSFREASLSGSMGDVVVQLPVRADARTPVVSVLTYQDSETDWKRPERSNIERHALILVSPPRVAAATIPRDITLALDVSGSMRGQKLVQAVAAGRALLTSLRRGDRFQLIAFSDEVESHAPALVAVTPSAIAAADRWLGELVARGGTNIGAAMQQALTTLRAAQVGDAQENRLPLTLLITDGQPTSGLRSGAILDSTTAWRHNVRVFTFGVGADVDATLVEQLALTGRGTAHFVRPEESVERAVSLLAERLTAPIMANITITLSNGKLQQLYAPQGQDLMAGRELIFLARYSGGMVGTVTLNGTSEGSTRRYTSRYEFEPSSRASGNNAFVPRLWAVQRVAALDAQRRRFGATPEIDDELRELGSRYGVPTPLTSYLVLEPQAVAGTRGAPGALRASSAPAAPAEASKAFEAARRSADQRAAVNISAADGIMEREMTPGSAPQRVVRGVLYQLVDGRWTDGRLLGTQSFTPTVVVRVKPYSSAWLEIASALPSLRDAMALGDRVLMRGRRATMELAADGDETLNGAQLRALVAAW